MDNLTCDDGPLRELALFAGAGGGILGGKLLGWQTVCAVEIDTYAASVLVARQNDGHLPPFPIWDDVRTFDGRPWRGIIEVISGGFPCQDISVAGNGAGIDGERSGLWREFARIIGEVRPRFAFVENSPALVSRGLGRVLGDLAEMGYDSEWGCVSAAEVGASHPRERMWIVASDAVLRRPQRRDVESNEKEGRMLSEILAARPFPDCVDDLPEPRVIGVGARVPNRVDRTKCIGNGQVPLVAAVAWRILRERLGC